MPVEPISRHDWPLVPPLDLPLALRVENGRFGALRPKPLDGPPPCSTDQVIAADDPSNPTGAEVHFITQVHEAVDLAAEPGDCVFAAYAGRVVAVETNRARTRGNVTIDHHPRGLGFLTKYNHVTEIGVEEGESVQKGAPFAAVSAEPAEAHLHFELWAVADRDSADEPGWPDDTDLVPVDPTRVLYAWEVRTAHDQELAPAALVPRSVGLVRLHAVPFFVARFDAETSVSLHVPMYEPMTEDERLAIALLRDAHRRTAAAAVRFRASSFWGVDVVTQVELA